MKKVKEGEEGAASPKKKTAKKKKAGKKATKPAAPTSEAKVAFATEIQAKKHGGTVICLRDVY